MKRNLQIMLGSTSVSMLAFATLAQEPVFPKTDEAETARNRITQARAERMNDAVSAAELLGMTVNNYQNEELGKVSDIAVDVESGRIVQVVLSIPDAKLTAVPPRALHHDAAGRVLHLDIAKEKFDLAPKLDALKWDEGTQTNRVAEVYVYYGEQLDFASDRRGFDTTNMDGTINTNATRTVNEIRNADTARDLQEANNAASVGNKDGTWPKGYHADEQRAKSPRPRVGYALKASKLIGMPVKNLQGQQLGKAENFIADLSGGRIISVIIWSGGFAGLGGGLSGVPPTALRLNEEHDTLLLDSSTQAFSALPHFKRNEWPDFSVTRPQ